jgi:hypothetical protein
MQRQGSRQVGISSGILQRTESTGSCFGLASCLKNSFRNPTRAEADPGLRPLLEAGAHGLEHRRPLQLPCKLKPVSSHCNQASTHGTMQMSATTTQAQQPAPTSVLNVVDDQGGQDGHVAARSAADLKHCSKHHVTMRSVRSRPA